MNTIDHRQVAPRLPGVVRSVSPQQIRVSNRTSSVMFASAGVIAVTGFYEPTLFVIAAFIAWAALILKLGKGQSTASFVVRDGNDLDGSEYEREMIPNTFEYRRRQERWWG